MKKYRTTIFLAVILVIVVINYINYKRGPQDDHSDHTHKTSHMMPEFNVTDVNGEPLNNWILEGKNTYFQFINPGEPVDIELFKAVYSEFSDEDLEMVIFTPRTPELLEKIEVDKNRVRIAEERFPSLRRLFRTAGNTGSFHLYDASGKKIASGKNGLEYEAGPKVYLNELIRGEFFSIDEFVKMGESVKNMEWMRQIDSIITGEDKKLFVFFLFINLCEPCGGGAVVDQLKQLNANYGKQAGIFSISYSRYTDRDIAALKSQAKIKFPITLADSLLFGKWESLIRRYNRRRLDNIVFVTDKSGKILNVMHSTCKCFRSFFRITHSIMKERLEI